MTHIYPPIEKRAKLNAAFDSLEGHLANPKYLLNVLLDSVGILFQYGPHLPKILRTGLKAMQSFKKANEFEAGLASAAEQTNRKAPFSQEDIAHFMAQLSKSDVDRFVNESLVLFETLHDRKLVTRVIDIVNRIIGKMRKRPNIYPTSEVDALELGRDLIVEGNKLFESLTTQEQHILFDMVVKIERDVLKGIFQ